MSEQLPHSRRALLRSPHLQRHRLQPTDRLRLACWSSSAPSVAARKDPCRDRELPPADQAHRVRGSYNRRRTELAQRNAIGDKRNRLNTSQIDRACDEALARRISVQPIINNIPPQKPQVVRYSRVKNDTPPPDMRAMIVAETRIHAAKRLCPSNTPPIRNLLKNKQT